MKPPVEVSLRTTQQHLGFVLLVSQHGQLVEQSRSAGQAVLDQRDLLALDPSLLLGPFQSLRCEGEVDIEPLAPAQHVGRLVALRPTIGH